MKTFQKPQKNLQVSKNFKKPPKVQKKIKKSKLSKKHTKNPQNPRKAIAKNFKSDFRRLLN
jgi:hypothetical protein